MGEFASYLCGVAAATVGMTVGNIVSGAYDSHQHQADERVAQVQVYNAELQQQLELGHKLVASLVVDDQGKHFTFHTLDQEHKSEVCNGEFEIRNKTAVAVGNLACTERLPVSK